jgi:hypothetical protein
MLAVAAVVAACAVPAAAQEWEKDPDRSLCTNRTIGFEMFPEYRGVELNMDASARMVLVPAERDVGVRVNFQKSAGGGAAVSSASLVFPDAGYNFEVGVVRVSIDGAAIAAQPDERDEDSFMYGVPQWYPANEATWEAAVARGRMIKIELFDTGNRLALARELELEPVGQAAAAIQRARWTC